MLGYRLAFSSQIKHLVKHLTNTERPLGVQVARLGQKISSFSCSFRKWSNLKGLCHPLWNPWSTTEDRENIITLFLEINFVSLFRFLQINHFFSNCCLPVVTKGCFQSWEFSRSVTNVERISRRDHCSIL